MEIRNIPVGDIATSPMNPRKTFDEEAIAELAANIEKQGLLQPITVRPMECSRSMGLYTAADLDIRYEIVCGERRYRAVSMLHRQDPKAWPTIAAIVREMDDEEAFDAMITENLQRRDVDPIEEAFAFSQLVRKGNTAEEIALRFGKSVRFVVDRIKLNGLIDELKQKVTEGVMSLAAAMLISKLEEEAQRDFFDYFGDRDKIDKETADGFCSRRFMRINRASWFDNNPNYSGGCGRSCRECPMNTANEGCLFYDTDKKDGNCTDRDKFVCKLVAFASEQVESLGNLLVKKGEPIEKGKVLIVDNYDPYYGRNYDNCAADYHDRLADALKEKYEIVNPNASLGSRVYGNTSSARIAEMLEKGECYRCLSLTGMSGYSCRVEEVFYQPKAIVENKETVSKEDEAARVLVEKYKAAKNKQENLRQIELRHAVDFNMIPQMPTDELSDREMMLAVVCMMRNTSYQYKHKIGVAHIFSDEEYRHVENNPQLRNQIIREFIREMVRSASSDSETMRILTEEVCKEWTPRSHAEITAKNKAETEKKLQKIADKLEALGYDTDGKKIEFEQVRVPYKD